MKYQIWIIAILISASVIVSAQQSHWTKINMKTEAVFVSVYFLDENLGWVIGRFPFQETSILKTEDGGESWFEQQKELPLALTSICFTDAKNGWAVGENGKIIHTTDGGESWFLQNSGTRYNLNSVCFINSKIGWAVGIFGRILHTTDGGDHWQKQYSGNSINFINSVYFLDSQTGWIVGEGGVIFKTTDGGSTWKQQYIPLSNDLNSVCFKDGNHGWIVGQNAVILGTIDGGSNWNVQNSPVSGNSQGDTDLYSVYFTDIETGWAVGRDGIILSTLDGGAKWEQENIGATNNLYSVFFLPENTGWAVGTFGTILKYESILSSNQSKYPLPNLSGTINLEQNYPNPFNPTTEILFTLPKASDITLMLYDVLGREVAVLAQGRRNSGVHRISFNAEGLPGGVYLYKLKADNFVDVKKMVLMK
jgi:photosystem II stability/assembly factor-like uncharacterized protein